MTKKAKITGTIKNEEGVIVGQASGRARELAKVEAEAHRQLYVWRYNRGMLMTIPKNYTREQTVEQVEEDEIEITHHSTDPPPTHSQEEWEELFGGTKL